MACDPWRALQYPEHREVARRKGGAGGAGGGGWHCSALHGDTVRGRHFHRTLQDVTWGAEAGACKHQSCSHKGTYIKEVGLCHRCAEPVAQRNSQSRLRWNRTALLKNKIATEADCQGAWRNENGAVEHRPCCLDDRLGRAKWLVELGFTGRFQCPRPGEWAENHRTIRLACFQDREGVSVDAFLQSNQFKIKKICCVLRKSDFGKTLSFNQNAQCVYAGSRPTVHFDLLMTNQKIFFE